MLWNYRMPAVVDYKGKQHIAYRHTKGGVKVKLLSWNTGFDFFKAVGTPDKGSTDVYYELAIQHFNGHDYFKVDGRIFSCSTGDEIKDNNIIKLFDGSEKTALREDPEQGFWEGMYNAYRHQQNIQDKQAGIVPAVPTTTAPASVFVEVFTQEPKKEVDQVKQHIQHLLDTERIKQLSSNTKVKGVYGRDYHMIRAVSKGRAYRVFTMDKGKDCKEILHAMESFLIIAVNKPDTVLFAVSEEPTKFLGWFKDFGFGIKKGPKLSKRLSQFIRPYLMFASFGPKIFNIKILTKQNWAGDFRTIDGANIISTRAFRFLLAVTVGNLIKAGDLEAADLIQQMGEENVVFNGRLWLPGYGFIKGQFFVSPFIKEDFIIHEGNIKDEIRVNCPYAYLGMDPQPGKLSLESNGQGCNNFPPPFGIGHGIKVADSLLYKNVVKACDKALERLKTGKLETSLKDLLILLQNNLIEESETTKGRLNLAHWSEFDSPKSNPALFGREAKDGLRRMVDLDELNINVKVDGGTYCQTVSESVMALIGVPTIIEKGTVQYNSKWMVYVMNDEDYIENLPNHGGPDMDDKFCQILMRQEGFDGIRCFMYRNPSDRGEYNVLTFKGEPPVKISEVILPAKMPLKLTERDWKLPEVPSATRPKVAYVDAEYAIDEFYKELDLEGANPGLGINVGSLWNASNPDVSLRNKHMPSNEQQVDSTVQLKDGADIVFIKGCMVKTMREVLESTWMVDYRRLQNVKKMFKDNDHYATWVAKLKKQGRLPDRGNWWTRLVTECDKVVKATIEQIDQTIESIRLRNNYNLISPTPLNASQLEMVARYVSKMMRVQGACGRTPETRNTGLRNAKDSITEKGHEWIRKGMKEHFNTLCDKFVSWGLVEQEGIKLSRTPVRVAIAMAHVVNNHTFVGRENPIVTDWLMDRKEYFNTYLSILKAYKKATVAK